MGCREIRAGAVEALTGFFLSWRVPRSYSLFNESMRVALFLFILSQGISSAEDVRVETILERHLEAIGADALREQTSRILVGTLSFPSSSRPAMIEVRALAPDQMLTRIDHPVLGMSSSGSDGATTWVENPDFGARSQFGRARRYALEEGRFYRDAEIRERYKNWAFVGRGSIDGHDVFHLSATDVLDEPVDFYIDRETHWLLRLETSHWAGETTDRLVYEMSEYREIDGFWTPFRVALIAPEVIAFELTVERIEFGVVHPPSTFVPPENLRE